MAEKKFYLTTTLPYVNAEPHIGFALEIVHADIIARYRRFLGDEVFFNTGTDEHGQKIFQAAQKEGKTVEAYVDHYAQTFEILKNGLGLSYDAFIRTTNPAHVAAAQELWRRCAEAGDIYKKKYKGLYCVGDEAFLRESDLVDGKCPNHPNMDLQEIEEENYFFKLSAYQEKLRNYLSNSNVILPDWRREEAINFVKGGLEDFSISREKARMSWGIPVPDDDSQVMYVWFDALTNYISTLGWPEDKEGNFNKFWNGGEVVQIAGKDQVRFQSIMWQAMLMSAKIKNTDKVVYHGFITSGGHKMSKSLGNVIDPLTLVGEYGTDAVRYFLAGHVHSFEDTDVTPEKFKEIYNAFLANGLGNLVSRVMQLASLNNIKIDNNFVTPQNHTTLVRKLTEDISKYEIESYVATIGLFISTIDEKISQKKPFAVIRENRGEGEKIIQELLHNIREVAEHIKPIMPQTSKKIIEAIMANKKPENLFPRKD